MIKHNRLGLTEIELGNLQTDFKVTYYVCMIHCSQTASDQPDDNRQLLAWL